MKENKKRYNFIVAEPSLGVHKFIGYCIKPYGFTSTVYTATGLLKKLETIEVDILITEIDHWDMDFEELYAKIKKNHKTLTVIFITSRSIFEVKHMPNLRNSDLLLHKPFKKELLIEAVEEAIESLKNKE